MRDELNLFDIDPERIEDDWIAQSSLYHEHAVILADCRADYERCKAREDVLADELKEIHAQLFLEISKNPASAGLDKATVDTLKSAVLIHGEYIQKQKKGYKAREETIKAEHAMGVAKAVVDALYHKKEALQDLVRLHLNDIHASPRAPKEAQKRLGDAAMKNAFTAKGRRKQ